MDLRDRWSLIVGGMTGSAPTPPDLFIREQFDLALLESGDSGDGVFNADGTVNMVLIRPCNGRGPGQRIYEAEMLAAAGDNGTFKGWPMFDNHDAPTARRARDGFPRPPSELAGVIREHFWDPTFTTPDDANLGFGPGAVIGRCALSDPMEALVRKIPEAIKGSLNAQATTMRLGQREGKRGWIVEGIQNDPENSSFDLVTKAGAGGRVRSILESLYDPTSATTGIADEELDMSGLTLQEALQSDEVKNFIGTQITEGVQEVLKTALPEALAAQNTELVESIRDEVRAELGETNRLRGLHAEAKRIIEASKLPAAAKTNLLADYGLEDNDDDTVTPGRSLALIESVVEDDKVVKSAKEVLKDDIEEEIKRVRNVIRESAPTVPVTHGASPDAAAGAAQTFGGEGSAWAERARARGLDPAIFGATPKPDPEPATT